MLTFYVMLLFQETKEKYGYNPAQLSKGSNRICLCYCDYCGQVIEKKYFKWINARKFVQKDACSNKVCRLQKQEENNLVKIGVKHHSQTQDYKEKYKKTCLQKYGVDNPFKDVEKIQQSVENKYGVKNVALLKSVKDKKKETNLERYGVEYPYQNKKILKKVVEKIRQKYGVVSYGMLQKNTQEFIERLCDAKNYKLISSYSDYKNRDQKLLFLCLTHNINFHSSVLTLTNNDHQCPRCKVYKTSKSEKEIGSFIKSLGVHFIENNRNIISPLELDIYIPDYNLAIEYNGLYWHSELCKSKQYHYTKFVECKKQGIQLLQIYEDEWRNKQLIWQSMLDYKLGLSKKKDARKLVVNPYVKNNKMNKFFNLCHLGGNCKHEICFSLEDRDGVVYGALSLRKPFIKKYGNCIEIARLATRKGYYTPGGFSKLMKYAIEYAKKNKYESIITYSDCRYSLGNVYSNYGFEFLGHSGVSYGYTDLKQRYNRFKFRAQDGLTEKQYAMNCGVYRIYGPGNYRWKLSI